MLVVKTLTSKLDDLAAERQLKLKKDLAKADNVSLTLDTVYGQIVG